MSWVTLRRPCRCSRCARDLAPGERARFGDRVRTHIWCERCARAGLQEEPPLDPPPQDVPLPAGSQRELAFEEGADRG
ncbi:MAG: hypothetical protein AB7R67_20110 [Vicinamibacterales bacterium]